MTARSWVSNDTDVLIGEAQTILAGGGRLGGKLLSTLMDLISGVEGYVPSDLRRQGIIARLFTRELSKSKGALKSANYLITLEDLISIFWSSVLETIPAAKRRGEVVSIRTSPVSNRPTNSNAINYIRSQSITKTRNYLNEAYTKALVQGCNHCGHYSSPRKEEVLVGCSKCLSTASVVIWPDGNAKYLAKKKRQCLGCKHTWDRRFEYTCGGCHLQTIHIYSRMAGQDWSTNHPLARSVEEEALEQEQEQELTRLLSSIREALPKNPADTAAQSRTMELFDLIVDPVKSVDMCAKCRLSSANSCGAPEFNAALCVNYSKKIGEYTNCSASLVARRMQQIRATTMKYLRETQHSSELSAKVLSLLRERT